jgi:uncharacterized protein
MGFEVEVYTDASAFEAAVRGLLERREAENALLLGLLGARVPSKFMACATSDGLPVLVAYDGGFNLIVSRGPPAAITAMVEKLQELGMDLPGVCGPVPDAEHFAEGWAAARACDLALEIDQRIYELTAVCWPSGVAGRLRAFTLEELELAAAWGQAFDREALPPSEWRTLERAREKMIPRIEAGMLFGWEHERQLVAMAGLARPTSRTISVNSVYTPPEHRRRGFASALVAALSAEGLRRGKQRCVLYTDLANPTSNAIYQRIGYRPVCDARNYRFRARL